MEKRLLIAFLISAAIVAVWSMVFPPPERPEPPPVVEEIETETPSPTETETLPEEPVEEPAAEAEAVAETVVEGDKEELVSLHNELIEVQLSTRGAAIKSLILKDFKGDERIGEAGEKDRPPLDLVQTLDTEWRALPLQLVVEDEPDFRLYAVEEIDGGWSFTWADGHGNGVRKELRLNPSGYGLELRLELRGRLREALLSVGTGMRDTGPTERANRFATWGDVAVLVAGEVERFKREKVKERTQVDGQGVVFAGFADTYFLSLLRPRGRVERVNIVPFEYSETDDEGEVSEIKVLQVLVEPYKGELEAELFSAPKQYDLLQQVGGGVESTLDFGFFHPISVLFLKALQWTYARVHNYGFAIMLLTLGIRLVLFPLMHKSTVSMRKMQKLQPKVKAIQEKYKKNKSDPQVRAKMNQEMMELYRAEGVNPMGGCLPMLVQLPILWALYTLFAHAIELRQAPFIFWIEDLSAKDPYLITPILMTATMWLQQKMAPQAGDPQQQRIFRLMPFIFGFMFLGFPAGLVLYWLTNNVITILQQEVTFKLMGERRGGKAAARREDDSGKKASGGDGKAEDGGRRGKGGRQ